MASRRARNVHVRDGISEDEFVRLREARDKTLDMPKLIIPSLQVNIRGGRLPEPEAGGERFLKVPVTGCSPALLPDGSRHGPPRELTDFSTNRRQEILETVALAPYMNGGPAAVRAYGQFSGPPST